MDLFFDASFLLNKSVTSDGEMEQQKFSVFASFCLCIIMFSMMFKPANGEKFSLAAISDSIQDLVKFFQVILFFILKNIYLIFFGKLFLTERRIFVILMIGTCEIPPAESYEYVFGGVVRVIVSKAASWLRQQNN